MNNNCETGASACPSFPGGQAAKRCATEIANSSAAAARSESVVRAFLRSSGLAEAPVSHWRLAFLFMLLAAPAAGACIPVTGDRILGRDLARADARFSALPATLTIAYAPSPATQRIFASAELLRIARANGITVTNPDEICFEVPMQPITEEEALLAMRRSLPPGAALNIVEMQKTGVPAGEIEFPVAGLEPAAPGAQGVQLWRGFVRYTPTRKAQIWARVSARKTCTPVIASRDLPPNVPISAADLRTETRTMPLDNSPIALSVTDVLGYLPRRPIKAGEPIPLAILEQPVRIHRGQPVKVEVRSGRTRLMLDAIAERDGRDGELVELRNPLSGRTFKARLAGSLAVIVIDSGQLL